MRKRRFAAILLSKIDSSRLPDEYRNSINLINSLNRLLSLNYMFFEKKQIIHQEEIAITD